MRKSITRIILLLERNGVEPWNWHTRQSCFHVLIGTVLSQRTKDRNTDRAAARLFERYSTPEEIAGAPLVAIQSLIKPAGFYRVKARRIKEISRLILDKYGGRTPDSIAELMKLPGVGRKTAGCVMVYGHGRAESIPVDTHVHRISNRIGLVKTRTPEQTEKALMKTIPREHWIKINQLFVIHGQNTCRPVGPRCKECPIRKFCDYYSKLYLSSGQ